MIVPKWLNAEAKKEFKRINRITDIDERKLDWLCLYCEALAEYKEAVKHIKDEGYLIKINNGKTLARNLWYPIKKDAMINIKAFGKLLFTEEQEKEILEHKEKEDDFFKIAN